MYNYKATPDKSDMSYAGTEKFLDKIRDHISIKTKLLLLAVIVIF